MKSILEKLVGAEGVDGSNSADKSCSTLIWWGPRCAGRGTSKQDDQIELDRGLCFVVRSDSTSIMLPNHYDHPFCQSNEAL
jgi:hypothetical protein